jgi:hypothetical protein
VGMKKTQANTKTQQLKKSLYSDLYIRYHYLALIAMDEYRVVALVYDRKKITYISKRQSIVCDMEPHLEPAPTHQPSQPGQSPQTAPYCLESCNETGGCLPCRETRYFPRQCRLNIQLFIEIEVDV